MTLVRFCPRLKKKWFWLTIEKIDLALVIWWMMVVGHFIHYPADTCSGSTFINRARLRDLAEEHWPFTALFYLRAN